MTQTIGSAMRREMTDQPAVLGRLVTAFPQIVNELKGLGAPNRAGLAILARGSSDNAARVAAYCAQVYAGIPVHTVSPSVFTTLGQQPKRFSQWLVMAVSQSGRTPEIVDLAERFAAAGALVVGVTNDNDSPLAVTSHYHVDLTAGTETAVPATKTVSSQMLAGIAIAASLGGTSVDPSALAALPEQAAGLLAEEPELTALVNRITAADRAVMIGRAYLAAAAFESALKMQETTGILAHAFSTADFRHGPIRLTAEKLPVIAFTGSSAADQDTAALTAELAAAGRPVSTVGSRPGAELPIPTTTPELEAILATIRGQQLALATALDLGIDPDQPTGLSKVTLTE